MNITDNFIPKDIKLEEIKDSKIRYDINPKIDKNLYIQKLEAEIIELKAEMELIKKEELYESEERYRSIFENSLDGILLATCDGTIISANCAACQMLGRNEAEMCVVGRKGIVDLDDPRLRKAIADRDATGTFSSELTMVRKDGTILPTEVTSKVFKDRKGNILTSMIIRDVSERKKAEALLLSSEQKFSEIFYNNQAMMAIVSVSGHRFIDINNAALIAFGFNAEEIIGKSLLELNLWVDIQQRKEILKKIAQYGAVKDFPCQFRSKGNEVVFMLCTANYINVGSEKYILVSAFDITSQKKVEEDLRTSEELFYKSFNANPLSMAIISIETETFMEVNESFVKISGNYYDKKDLIGRKEDEVVGWVDLSERDKFIGIIKQEGSADNFEVRFEKKQSGEITTALLSGVIISWRKEKCMLVVANDITELRRYQNEMIRMDRLKLIGVTSAGIAHEIRNPLTTVKGFLQLFKEKEKYADDREHMDLMIEELDRANVIITEFLSLAKNKAGNLKMQNLNASIRKMLPLLESEALKKGLFIKQELEEIPDLMIDQGEIRQLILNLVQNGLDAMSADGSLTIKTYKNSEGGVTLAIKDQGKGINPEIMDKIGMPFFTTKDYGLGLGLAICYNIAHRNNARIDVKTGQKGTTFKVNFPLIVENLS